MNKNLWILCGIILVLDGAIGASITRSSRTDEAPELPAVLDTVVPEVQVDSLKKEPVIVQEVVKEEIVGRNVEAPQVVEKESLVAVPEVVVPNVAPVVPEKLVEIIQEKSLGGVEQPVEQQYVDALKLVSTEDKADGVTKVVENVIEALKNVPEPEVKQPETAPIIGNEVVPSSEVKLVVVEEKAEEPKSEIIETVEIKQEIVADVPAAKDLKNEEVKPEVVVENVVKEAEPLVAAPLVEPIEQKSVVSEILSDVKELEKVLDENMKEEDIKFNVEEPKQELLKLDEPKKEEAPEEEKLKELIPEEEQPKMPEQKENIVDETEMVKRIDTNAETLEYVDTKLAKEEIMEQVKNELPEVKDEMNQEKNLNQPEEPKPMEEALAVKAEEKIDQVIENIEAKSIGTLPAVEAVVPAVEQAPVVEPVKEQEELLTSNVKTVVDPVVAVDEPVVVGKENLDEKPQVKEDEPVGKNLEHVEEPKPESVVPEVVAEEVVAPAESIPLEKSVDPKLDVEDVQKQDDQSTKQTTSAPNIIQSAIQNALGAIGLGGNQVAADQPQAEATTARPNIIQQIQSGIQGFLGNNQAASASASTSAAPLAVADEAAAPTTARPAGIIANLQNAVNSTLNRPSDSPQGPLATFVSNLLGNQSPSTVAPAAAP